MSDEPLDWQGTESELLGMDVDQLAEIERRMTDHLAAAQEQVEMVTATLAFVRRALATKRDVE